MDIVAQTIEEIKKKNWDFYRENYRSGVYSFAEIKLLHNLWFPMVNNNNHFNSVKIAEAFDSVVEPGAIVVELGCGHGHLANLCMGNHGDIAAWIGLDICDLVLKEHNCTFDNFEAVCLDRQLWEYKADKLPGDIFISSHTLEHFTHHEVIKIVTHLQRHRIGAVVIEVPLEDGDYFWKNGGSAHVLDKGWLWFKRVMAMCGYILVYEWKAQRRGKVGAWQLHTGD